MKITKGTELIELNINDVITDKLLFTLLHKNNHNLISIELNSDELLQLALSRITFYACPKIPTETFGVKIIHKIADVNINYILRKVKEEFDKQFGFMPKTFIGE